MSDEFYAVVRGRTPGIYRSWTEFRDQVHSYECPFFDKFNNQADAEQFLTAYADNFNATVPKSSSSVFYAVAAGRKRGIFDTWDECRVQIDNFKGAKFKKFSTQIEAQQFVDGTWVKPTAEDEQSDQVASKKRSGNADDKNGAKRKKWTNDDDQTTDDIPVVYTDGACHMNGKHGACAGIGVYWSADSKLNVSARLEGTQTNNRAELQAVCVAVQQAIDNGYRKLIVRTDSKLLIDSMDNWIDGWKRKGWKTSTGTDVKNRADLEQLDGLMQQIEVKFEKVKAHSDIEGNEQADRLAVAGTKMPKSS